MSEALSSRNRSMPLSGCHIRILDVDHQGVTVDGERFDVEPKVYRDHFTVEDAVLRYPDGTLKLVQRVISARQIV